MRPLLTPLFLRALRLLLPLAACGWGPTVASPNSKGVSAYWNDIDTPVHLYAFGIKKGFYLEIRPYGKVKGSTYQSPYTALIMKALEPDYISFIGAKSKLNLCMYPNGNLFGTASYTHDDCVFKQIRLETHYDVYESYKHKILLSLGHVKRPFVPNKKLPRFSQFRTQENEIAIDEIYPPEHQEEQW